MLIENDLFELGPDFGVRVTTFFFYPGKERENLVDINDIDEV